jgi:hypothetical protein
LRITGVERLGLNYGQGMPDIVEELLEVIINLEIIF